MISIHSRILFQDENVVVVDKPALFLSVPSRIGERDERPCLGTLLAAELGQQIFPVHRLDFEVSGVMIFALNAKVHRDLSLGFEQKKITKCYRAVTEPTDGSDLPPVGIMQRWTAQILRGKKRAYPSPVGKHAETLATLLTNGRQLYWDLWPLTGRAHQLRWELYRHGCPILGDELYSAKSNWELPGIALCAIELCPGPELQSKWSWPAQWRLSLSEPWSPR